MKKQVSPKITDEHGGERPNDLRHWSRKGYACGSNKLRINKKLVSLHFLKLRLEQKIWAAHAYWLLLGLHEMAMKMWKKVSVIPDTALHSK